MREVTTEDDRQVEKQTQERLQRKEANTRAFYKGLAARILGGMGVPEYRKYKDGTGRGGRGGSHGFARGTYGKIRRQMKRQARMF